MQFRKSGSGKPIIGGAIPKVQLPEERVLIPVSGIHVLLQDPDTLLKPVTVV
jgi:hypothetical protein